jgi:hypothetical protein
MEKYETQIIRGKEFEIIWEVIDERGNVVKQTVGEEQANDFINDAGKQGVWIINDWLEEVEE